MFTVNPHPSLVALVTVNVGGGICKCTEGIIGKCFNIDWYLTFPVSIYGGDGDIMRRTEYCNEVITVSMQATEKYQYDPGFQFFFCAAIKNH